MGPIVIQVIGLKKKNASCHNPLIMFLSDSYHEYTSQYLIHIWLVTILSLATFIKFYYLYKAVLLLVMYAVYSVLILTLMNWTSGV